MKILLDTETSLGLIFLHGRQTQSRTKQISVQIFLAVRDGLEESEGDKTGPGRFLNVTVCKNCDQMRQTRPGWRGRGGLSVEISVAIMVQPDP